VAITRRSFTAEYRVEAAHRVIDSGRTITEVGSGTGDQRPAAGGGGSGRNGFGRAAAVGVPDVPDTPVTESERAELVRLRRKVVDQARQFQEQERDVVFLKNAPAYFATLRRCNRNDIFRVHRSSVRCQARR